MLLIWTIGCGDPLVLPDYKKESCCRFLCFTDNQVKDMGASFPHYSVEKTCYSQIPPYTWKLLSCAAWDFSTESVKVGGGREEGVAHTHEPVCHSRELMRAEMWQLILEPESGAGSISILLWLSWPTGLPYICCRLPPHRNWELLGKAGILYQLLFTLGDRGINIDQGRKRKLFSAAIGF